MDVRSKEISLENKKKITLQIWDTAGHERFRAMTDSYYRQAQGVIIVFDLTNTKSFEELKNWLHFIKLKTGEDIPKVLVGNKCDLIDNIEVKNIEIDALIQLYNLKYIAASAKTDENVNEIFIQLAKLIVEKENGNKSVNNTELAEEKKLYSIELESFNKNNLSIGIKKKSCC